MAVTELESLDPGEPLPRRKQLDVVEPIEPKLFGEGLTDVEYKEELGLYIGRKVLISSTRVRHFRSPLGMTVKFADDPLTLENELVPLLRVTTLPMDRNNGDALAVQWNHSPIGIVEPFVPLDRTVTTIYIPIE